MQSSATSTPDESNRAPSIANGDQVYVNRAKCHAAMGHLQEAIADYDCAIDINPYNINARLQQGILFRELKLYDDAIVCFGLALFLGGLKAPIYAERGRAYHLDGHWNYAIGDYQQALTILHQSPSPSLVGQIQTWMSELLDH
ncbi:tetratricopeptide repeat protein [Leptolyngbya cf. ectocarpi LEGE 11479]|uniref:Tetratricopeptide repeat protein n=1 Tax=Leptolyngbya cf. ectocarpi LEGE 11479 TaxID=1828722 RepID=A0A928ZVP8_LEPEC|nr:tetratricopeptide repeat protein [Leptolyngbya ectocarpi]MBE9068335.1 tetratricopeptide repeat protein [Leptolyngbya cf. ectocarpi LEGE 11479]